MNRKERRSMEKMMDPGATENLAEKIFQFKQLPQACSACEKAFDKKSKDMVQSWSVVVRQEVVRLFCPTCIQKTREVLKNVEDTKNRQS